MRRTTTLMLVALLLVPSAPAHADCTEVIGITFGECEKRRKNKPRSGSSELAVARRAERRLLALVNETRRDHGLAPLTLHENARTVAREHARRMARRGRAYHNPDLDSSDTRRRLGYPDDVAENVGFGPSVGSVHRAFMNSEAHRRNVLAYAQDAGFGVIRSGETIYVTELFMRGASDGTGATFAGARAGRSSRTHAARASVTIPLVPDGIVALGRDSLSAAAAEPLPWGWMALAVIALAVPGSIRTLARRRSRL